MGVMKKIYTDLNEWRYDTAIGMATEQAEMDTEEENVQKNIKFLLTK